mgnify:CR=1 FL=1
MYVKKSVTYGRNYKNLITYAISNTYVKNPCVINEVRNGEFYITYDDPIHLREEKLELLLSTSILFKF